MAPGVCYFVATPLATAVGWLWGVASYRLPQGAANRRKRVSAKTHSRKLGGLKRAGVGLDLGPFPLSSPYSSTLLGSTLLRFALVVGSSALGALAQEVIIAATFSVLR